MGVITGQFYLSDALGLKKFRFPVGLQNLTKEYILPILGSTKAPRRSNRAFPDDSVRSLRSGTSRRTGTRAATDNGEAGAPNGLDATTITTSAEAESGHNNDQEEGVRAPTVDSGGNSTSSSSTNLNPDTVATMSSGSSVMREWVDELTGRSERAAAGLRVPSEEEINQLMSMFPDLRREDVVGTLQRR